MDTSLRETERHRGGPSSRACAPTWIPLRQRLALAALVTGISLWIRVFELTDAHRDLTSHTRLEKS
jgi:hypothetical protein